MPRRQPFTALCQQAGALARPALADLHTHTTASDGDFTPSQVVAFAAQAGLKAVAITDHDTTAGHAEAEAAGRENRSAVELVRGVEISTFCENREYHLLAYDVRPSDDFQHLLQRLQAARKHRFEAYLSLLEGEGHALDSALRERLSHTPSLGRRHVARLLVQSHIARSHHDAFRRFLLPLASRVERLRVVTVADAITQVHLAGGVASLAHPSPELTFEELARLRGVGLDAVEVAYPAATYSRSQELRSWATTLGLACTGGSDCHGPERRVGSTAVPMHDLLRLRQSAASAGRSEPAGRDG